MDPIIFEPIYKERVWGGSNFASKLGRSLTQSTPIGESWEIVDRPEAQSTVTAGPLKGRSLRALIKAHPEAIMGPGWDPERPFPILVKWLDCAERLSLQVHPPADVAPKLGGEPKTEHWYVQDATLDAALIVGHKAGVTPEAFEAAIHANTLEDCVERHTVSKGDALFVESGCLHAIDAGCLILEIQQNSDTTYRVYDWGRKGLDGKLRELHIKEALASISFEKKPPAIIHKSAGNQLLADCPHFRIRKEVFPAGAELRFEACQEPRILSILEGEINGIESALSFCSGANVLLPYEGAYIFKTQSPTKLLITDHFNQ